MTLKHVAARHLQWPSHPLSSFVVLAPLCFWKIICKLVILVDKFGQDNESREQWWWRLGCFVLFFQRLKLSCVWNVVKKMAKRRYHPVLRNQHLLMQLNNVRNENAWWCDCSNLYLGMQLICTRWLVFRHSHEINKIAESPDTVVPEWDLCFFAKMQIHLRLFVCDTAMKG